MINVNFLLLEFLWFYFNSLFSLPLKEPTYLLLYIFQLFRDLSSHFERCLMICLDNFLYSCHYQDGIQPILPSLPRPVLKIYKKKLQYCKHYYCAPTKYLTIFIFVSNISFNRKSYNFFRFYIYERSYGTSFSLSDLILLSIMSLRHIHVVVNGNILFFYVAE